MMDQLDGMLADAAAGPLAEPDVSDLYRRARLRHRRRSATAVTAAVVLALLVVVVPLTSRGHEVGFISPPTPTAPGDARPGAIPDAHPPLDTPATPLPLQPVETPPPLHDRPDAAPHPPTPSPSPSGKPPPAPDATPTPGPTTGPPPSSVQHRPHIAVEGTAARSPIRAGEQLVVRYTNTGSVRVIYGAEYRYERYESGHWVPAEWACSACPVPLIGYILEPGQTRDFEADTTGLLPGRHRILKHFTDDSEAAHATPDPRQSVEVAVEFDVTS